MSTTTAVAVSQQTYELDPLGEWIKCLACNRISYYRQDVEALWCGRCRKTHPRVETEVPRIETEAKKEEAA